MVMFHHEIPYARALERGKVQQRILDELVPESPPADSAATGIDWSHAERLITSQLQPLQAPS